MKKIITIVLLFTLALQAQIPEKIESNTKSIPLGIALSVALPGSGQIYAGKPWMGILYLGIEAVAIGGSIYFNSAGAQEITKYESYADEHWNVENWLAVYNPNVDPTTHTSTVYVDDRNYSPQNEDDYARLMADMADGYTRITISKDYHFYENIGKYQQFKQGWDDWGDTAEIPSNPELGIYAKYSDSQYEYASMRRYANKLLDFGTYFGTAIFLNHFISAIDAGFRIKNINDKQDILLTLEAMPIIRPNGISGIQTGINVAF